MSVNPWTSWANGNQNGSVDGPLYTPSPVTAIKGMVEDGYGLVNLALGFTDVDGTQQWTQWFSTDHNGREVSVSCPPGTSATGMTVSEQAGHGLVDANLIYSGGFTKWLTGLNGSGQSEPLTAPAKMFVTGSNIREQPKFGLINIQLHVG